jgi:hypothetical protein
MGDDKRVATLQFFRMFLCKQYKEEVADWCCLYWRQIDQKHITLLKYLRMNPTTVDTRILMLSLTVVVPD